jgi:antitoxin ParD1/3/4
MQTMNISLPDQLKEFVEDQVESGRYKSVSDYVSDLIQNDERRAAQDRVEALLLEGLEGESTEMTRQDWEDIRAEGMHQLEARKTRKSAETRARQA